MSEPDPDVVGVTSAAPTAFEGFYESEYAAIVRIAFGLTGRLGIAEELAQDAFLAAYRKWDTLAAYDDPAAWVRRAVMNRAVSVWRRSVTEARLLARLQRERVVSPALEESHDAAWIAIRKLPRRQREAMALVVLEGRPVADVAEVLGCSVESVRTHLRRARLRLAQALKEEDRSHEP